MQLFQASVSLPPRSRNQVAVPPKDRSIDSQMLFSTFLPTNKYSMRAFHLSWWGFFIAFFIWFSIAPLLTEIKQTLGLTKEQIWTSSIVGVAGTIAMRFILGPLCDKFGARGKQVFHCFRLSIGFVSFAVADNISFCRSLQCCLRAFSALPVSPPP